MDYCSLSIAGMSANGSSIYDEVYCSTHDGQSYTFDERGVDAQTGALSQAQQVYQAIASLDGFDSVQIVKSYIFDFAHLIGGLPTYSLGIYPLKPNSTKPLIMCNSTMLAACSADVGVAHPSGKYVFFTDPQQNTTEIDAVNFSAKNLAYTGTTFSTPTPNVIAFSPDGSIVYSWDQATNAISVFGFNSATAAIATGGVLTESTITSILAAERR